VDASDVVALVSVITSGAVGVTGLGVAAFSGYKDRRNARDLARTERHQARLERTYLDLIGYLYRRRVEAEAIRPIMGPVAQPVSATQDEIARVQSLVVAHASKAVYDLLDNFTAVLRSIANADIAITGIDEAETQTGRREDPKAWGGSASDYQKRILDDKKRLVDIEAQIHDQIRLELSEEAGRPVPTLSGPVAADTQD
jgi:hypothetical protein